MTRFASILFGDGKAKGEVLDVNFWKTNIIIVEKFSQILPRQASFSMFNTDMKKLFKIAVILLIVLIVVGAIAVHFFLDGEVKKAIERIGPKITKVDVKVKTVNIILLSGSGAIKGLVIGNPEGFKSPSSISLGKVKLSLKPTSLLSKKVVIQSIVLEAPEITFEQIMGKNNLLVLRKNLDSAGGDQEQAKEESSAKKLQVDEFAIAGGKIHVLVNLPGIGDKAVTVSLPKIYLKDLGKEGDGITPVELSKKILTVLLEESAKEAARAVTDLASGALILGRDAGTNSSGKITDSIGGFLKKKK